jgi:sterol desaturase/sphingolipid hydroxylase (fatty acid hydroxylase superfamily)
LSSSNWPGFAPQMPLAAYAINLLYLFWIHAEWIPKLGFLEGILNTPSAHRVHHGANLNYQTTHSKFCFCNGFI